MAAAIRLQKLLANHGVASRRGAEQLICAGRVRVNGTLIEHLGVKVDPDCDAIEVNGHPLVSRPQSLTLLLHKPAGVLSTCDDPFERPTVLGLLPHWQQRGLGLHPVGRLDADSSGALLLTNDGELTLRLTHPRYHQPKRYEVWVEGSPGHTTLERWRRGVLLEGRQTLPATVETRERERGGTLLEIVLVEGRNRQIRKVARLLGHPVRRLHRTAIGPLGLGVLEPGEYRPLIEAEIRQLRNACRDLQT